MDGFTYVDAGVAAIIIVSAILAYSRGLVRETMAIVGWIAAALLAFTFAGAAEPIVSEGVSLIPRLGESLVQSCELSILLSFAAVFVLALVVFSFFTPLLSSAVRNSALGPIDRGLGFLFGTLRGLLLVAVGFIVYDRVTVSSGIPEVEQSRSAAAFSRAQASLEQQIPEDAPGWILVRYEALVGECIGPTSL
ncbi:CvpA family protein [Jannaschia aquimarina]|uniref:CvpA protein n=1 Tax=Jannaschia aquimarina TaxID=935700 RepID=A0A0D1EEL8_9RHOB|nr:CvpA family protein [Jannaschia aquimarina]KIT16149.1 Colicin V production protein [Jannaschia aquimarina]SNT37126.1 membrane protein required for colicin V production [Jannaschia aquimarina]